jgi:uncharacterized protein DUF3307
MIDLKIVISILFIHFVADFIFQTDYMALNKSKNNLALVTHTIVYTSIFMLFGALYIFGTNILN